MKTSVEVPPTSGSKAPGSYPGGDMRQTLGSDSAGQRSLAAPSPNPSFPSQPDSGKEISWQARTPQRSRSVRFGGWEGEGAPRGSFATQPEAPGPRLPALWAWGRRPRSRRAAGPSAPARARAGGRRGALGSAGVPRPAEATYVCC